MPGIYLVIEIIIHYVMTLLYYLMNGWIGRAFLGPSHSLVRFTEYIQVNGWT